MKDKKFREAMRRIITLTALCLALPAILFVGCNSKRSGKDTLQRDSFRMARLGTPAVIDPHYDMMSNDYEVISYVFESFFWVSSSGDFEPRLATSMDISDDSLTYTFHLRKGVKFHSGGEMKATDVLWSLERASQSPAMLNYLEPIKTIEAPDNYTVVITLKDVNPIFPFMINSVVIFSEEAGKKLSPGFTEGNVGTGPYIISSYKSDELVVLERFNDWYLPLPKIEKIELYVVVDVITSLMAFENGDIDVVGVSSGDWERIKSSGNFSTYQGAGSQTVFMTMNHLKPPFNDIRVRQAFNYAVNRTDIIAGAVNGLASPAFFTGNPDQIASLKTISNNDPYPYNQQKAKQLLADAGFTNGLTLSEPITVLAGTDWVYVVEIIQQQLAEIGVTAKIVHADPSTFFGDLISGNYLFSINSWAWNIPDWYIYERLYSSGAIGDFNTSFYSNPRVDELFALARTTANQDVRNGAFLEIVSILQRDAVIIPLYYTHLIIAWNKDLHYDPFRPVTEYYWKNNND